MTNWIPSHNIGNRVGRKPDFLCIGAQKAGTSWFHQVFCERPDVWAPPFKEVHFFDYKFDKENTKWVKKYIIEKVEFAKAIHLKRTSNPDSVYLQYLDSIIQPPILNGNWYKEIFSYAPKKAICFETTPAYSSLPEEGVRFISQFLTRTKFIYIVRDPYERAISQIKMNIFRSKTFPSSEEEWFDLVNQPLVQQRGDFRTHILRWSKHFNQSRLLFLPFNQIKEEPEQVLGSAEQFLELDRFGRYRKIGRKIHSSPDIQIPGYVRKFIRNETHAQNVFLRSFFGDEFYNKI